MFLILSHKKKCNETHHWQLTTSVSQSPKSILLNINNEHIHTFQDNCATKKTIPWPPRTSGSQWPWKAPRVMSAKKVTCVCLAVCGGARVYFWRVDLLHVSVGLWPWFYCWVVLSEDVWRLFLLATSVYILVGPGGNVLLHCSNL